MRYFFQEYKKLISADFPKAEVDRFWLTVNALLPSIIDTPENRAAMPDADPSQWVAPEALADVMLFLASDGARAIHGACIPVSGLS